MKQIRALVVDDSALARELIVAILTSDPEIKVVGEAVNGCDAVSMVKELKPDIATMDIEMPIMDGLEAIEEIMAFCAVPILVVTTRGDARTAYAAISKGALDLVTKPDVNIEAADEFIGKVKMLSSIKVITHLSGKYTARQTNAPMEKVFAGQSADRVVAVASSTGGPDALSVILSGLPEKFPCPVVVAQHISEGFAPGMVEWLKGVTRMGVKVAVEGERLAAGMVYITPSEKHMRISGSREVVFEERQPKDIYRPSCDMLLSSTAQVYGARSIGIILTGMGTDGVLGMKKIKEAGGLTIAQDESSSIVFGMPKAAIESGCIDRVLPLGDVAAEMVKLVTAKAGARV